MNEENNSDSATNCTTVPTLVLDSENGESSKDVADMKENNISNKDEHVLFELPQDVLDPRLPARINRAAANIASAVRGTWSSLTSRKSSIDESSYDEG